MLINGLLIKKECKIDVDVIGPRIICKRPKSESDYSADYLKQLLDAAVQVMSNIGRLDDFVSLLEAIGKGLVSNNVALHLCLDIGALRRVKALSTMSYPKISMDWWLTVKIVIKGMLGASSFSTVPSNTITKMI